MSKRFSLILSPQGKEFNKKVFPVAAELCTRDTEAPYAGLDGVDLSKT